MGKRKVYQIKLKEDQVKFDCEALLNQLKDLGALTYKRMNVAGVRTGKGGRRKNPMAGIADLFIFLNCHFTPTLLQAELKATKGTQEESQVKWHMELGKYGWGHLYRVIKSVEALREWLFEYIEDLNLTPPNRDRVIALLEPKKLG